MVPMRVEQNRYTGSTLPNQSKLNGASIGVADWKLHRVEIGWFRRGLRVFHEIKRNQGMAEDCDDRKQICEKVGF